MFNRRTKVYAISDLHLGFKINKSMEIFGDDWENYLEKIKKDWTKKVKGKDIVVIAGDISWAMKSADAIPDLEWISQLPGKKVMIRGNHDYWWSSRSAVRRILNKDMYAVDNDSVVVDKYVFCGTRGWTVPEKHIKQEQADEKIYNREIRRLEMSLKDASKKESNTSKIIGMIHYPPFNSELEDSEFTRLFQQYGIKNVIYGHIHGKRSKSILEHIKNGVKYHLTSCDKLEHKLKRII